MSEEKEINKLLQALIEDLENINRTAIDVGLCFVEENSTVFEKTKDPKIKYVLKHLLNDLDIFADETSIESITLINTMQGIQSKLNEQKD